MVGPETVGFGRFCGSELVPVHSHTETQCVVLQTSELDSTFFTHLDLINIVE